MAGSTETSPRLAKYQLRPPLGASSYPPAKGPEGMRRALISAAASMAGGDEVARPAGPASQAAASASGLVAINERRCMVRFPLEDPDAAFNVWRATARKQ